MRLIRLFLYAFFMVGGLAPAAFGQQEQCLALAQTGVQPGTWDAVKGYFVSLNLSDGPGQRSRLLLLRSKIIELESNKQQLIDILNSHYVGAASQIVVSSQLSLTDIPRILDQIGRISRQLADISETGNLFAAEKAFKDLKINLDLKRAVTLCQIAQETALASPNRLRMATLIDDLRSELKAISGADEALAEYIKKASM